MITNCIHLDFNKENDLKVPSVQYDSGSRFVKIKLQQNKVPFEINGYRVTVVANKVDGTEIMNDCTILDGANGLVEFEITEQFNAVEGVVDCQLKLFKDEILLTSMPFSISVVKSVSTKEIVSSNELKTLVNALGEVQNIDNRFAQTNAQLSEVLNRGTTVEIVERTTKNELSSLISNGSITSMMIGDGSISDKQVDFFGYPNFNEFLSKKIFLTQGSQSTKCNIHYNATSNSRYRTKMIDVENERIELVFNNNCNRFIVGVSSKTQTEIKSEIENYETTQSYLECSLLYIKDSYIFSDNEINVEEEVTANSTILRLTPRATTKTLIVYYLFDEEETGNDFGADVEVKKFNYIPLLKDKYLDNIGLNKLSSNTSLEIDVSDNLILTKEYYLTTSFGDIAYEKGDYHENRRCFILELSKNTNYKIAIKNFDFIRVCTFDRTVEQLLNVKERSYPNNVIAFDDNITGDIEFLNTTDKTMVLYPYLVANYKDTDIVILEDGNLFDRNVCVQNYKEGSIKRKHIHDSLMGELSSNKADMLSLEYWTPPMQPDTWATDDASGKTGGWNGDSDSFVNEFYDKYVGEYDMNGNKNSTLQTITKGEEEPSYSYKVIKTTVGKDESNTYNIYKYEFIPTKYKKTIMLSSLMHTYEIIGGFSVARFMYYVMEEPDIHPSIRYIRDNVKIIVMPILNPWGFNQSKRTYGNVNKINMNRDFGYYGDKFEEHPNYTPSNTNEWNQRGDKAFSQIETVHIVNTLKEHMDELNFWIDCHTGTGWNQDVWCYSCFDDKIFRPKVLKTAEWLTTQWKSEGNSCEYNRLVEGRESHKLRYAHGYFGIPCATLEYVPMRFGGKHNGSMDLFQYLRKLANFIIGGLSELSVNEDLLLLQDKTHKNLIRLDLGKPDEPK